MAEGRFVVPEVVSSHFHIREGDLVGDFGAGTGYFIPTLSRLVGSGGRVYAFEIQRNLVDTLTNRVREGRHTNVEILWSDIEKEHGLKVDDGTLDSGVLVNTLFLIEEKEAAMKEMVRTLRRGAKFFIIDWSESFSGLGPHPTQVVSEQDARAYAESEGLVFERTFDAGAHHYGLAFRKP